MLVLGLLGSFRLLTLAKADTRAAAVLVDELDARLFKGTSDFIRCFRATGDWSIQRL